MKAATIPIKTKRGRPRSGQTNKAILKAAAEIVIASGLAEMTIEGVAERAGVGKASIYRRWPSKGALAFDAVVDAILAAEPTPDTGSLEGDLARVAESWVRLANVRRGGRTLAHFIAEIQSDPDLAVAWRERFVDRIRRERRPIIERAIARGEIAAGSDPELIMDVLYGPLYHRYLNGHLPLDESFARQVVRMVAAAAVDGAAASEPRHLLKPGS
jgi:AcrR family transcriptional regulator